MRALTTAGTKTLRLARTPLLVCHREEKYFNYMATFALQQLNRDAQSCASCVGSTPLVQHRVHLFRALLLNQQHMPSNATSGSKYSAAAIVLVRTDKHIFSFYNSDLVVGS